MLKCREVTRLLTLEAEVPLPRYRKAAVAFHLMICKKCRLHQAQLQQMRQWLDQSAAQELEQAAHALNDSARDRIAQRLQAQYKP